jgi:methylated-DNA-protein-cysteine methyltransferase related protein
MAKTRYFERVLAVVRRIPRGRVSTYGAVAHAAGFPGTARQVAWALRGAAGPPVPWQRVVGAGGRIRLPGEGGMHQRLLLELEGVEFSGGRIRLEQFEHQFPGQPGRRSAARRAAPTR